MPNLEDILEEIRNNGSEHNREGMSRFGINVEKAYGTSISSLRKIAKSIKMDHELALQLWDTDVHEARILASIIGDPAQMTSELLDTWVLEFNSWDICDQVCGNLFDKASCAWDKPAEWAAREETFVKRSGFVMMCGLAVHDIPSPDERFHQFFPIIEREAYDERNFVKKAVNWALRQIGKRTPGLRATAIEVGEKILKQESKAAKWIARDALRELRSDKINYRVERGMEKRKRLLAQMERKRAREAKRSAKS